MEINLFRGSSYNIQRNDVIRSNLPVALFKQN